MVNPRKGRYGAANGSTRAVRPWSVFEVLVRWFAEQANAPPDMMDSPVWMQRAIVDHETAGMPPEEAAIYRAGRNDSSLTGNWRAKGYIPWDAWPLIRDLTGISVDVLDVAMRKKMAGDNRPFKFEIPGPPNRSDGRRRDKHPA